MSSSAKPQLISDALCPFVQRSVITMLEKGADFDIRFIDISQPPAWFLEISPLGKVPVLRVGDTSVFESAVINEYLDETIEPVLHPRDPLTKALNRAWIEFASALLFDQYYLSIAADAASFERHQNDIAGKLDQLEQILQHQPFFNGKDFALVDAAFAPAFLRFELLEQRHPLACYEQRPKLAAWAKNLLARDSVRASVQADFATKMRAYIQRTAGYGAQLFA